MSAREIEKESVSVCDWRNGALKVSGDELWQLSTVDEAQPSSAAGDQIACTNLDEHVRLRLNPIRRWSEEQFSPHCQLPVKDVNSGLVLCFQAMARESIGIALSSEPNFVKQSVYEIHLGAVGNTSTSFQRKGIKERSLNVPSRVCHDKAWIPYWVCWFGGKVYAGIGNVPSEQCIGVLDDSESPVENIRYVGFGNLARGGSNNTHTSPVHIQKVLLTTIPPSLPEKLNALPADLPVVVVQSEEADEYRKLLEDYKKECNLRRSRAEKFGTAYKEPSPEAFLPWTQAKRLRENPEKGFVTGFDLQDPEELAKQEARKARFGITNDKPVVGEGEAAEMNIAEDDSNLKTLEVVQAWDKEQMLRPQRNDPPPALWKQNTSAQSGEEQDGTNDFAMEPPKPVEQVPAKIHLFAIDWAAFKQIRNKDLMSYFSIYGPTYIEWLADLSCNICFEDKFSAARALHNLSQDIPSPAPENVQDSDKEGYEAPDLGNMGWRFCLRPIRKVSNDRHGRRGTTARVLMRLALSSDTLDERNNSWPAPPGGFSSTKVLGPDSDFARGKGNKANKKNKNNKRGRDKGKNANQGPMSKKNSVPTYDPASGEDHPLLSQGLSAGRGGGFSVEELERERASKRAKASSD